MLVEIPKEFDRIHACPVVTTPQHRNEWYHILQLFMVKYREDREYDYK